MRNLKKILALVLALVMSLSLMATASAAETSTAASDYEVAVKVLKGLGVVRGDDGGIREADPITRAEAATLAYRIHTADVTDSKANLYYDLKDAAFTDLAPVSAWALGYIGYAHNAQIVKGNGNGTFNPTGNITGYEILAMALRAIGYGKNGEFEGVEWQINTAAWARREGLLEGVSPSEQVSLDKPASRGMVFQILLNAIQHPNVEFSYVTPDLYVKADQSMADALDLKKITGVVVANEWAALDDTTVMAEGKTRLNVDGKTYSVNYDTELEDIGESRLAYIHGSEVLHLEKDDLNTVMDNNGEETTVASLKGSLDVTGAEYYTNFADKTVDKSDWIIRYKVVAGAVDDDGNYTPAGWYINKDYTNWVKYLNRELSGDDTLYLRQLPTSNIVRRATVEVAYNNNNTAEPLVYTVTIQPDTVINTYDKAIMKEIFYTADRFGVNPDYIVTNYVYGEVYAGTSSLTDQSDIKSWNQFVETYIKDDVVTKFTAAGNGQWLKIIDNNKDGKAEYVLKTNYVLDKVVDSTTKNDVTTYYYNGLDITGYTYKTHTGYEPKVGDIVLYALIDGTVQMQKADEATASFRTVDYKERQAKTADGTTHEESDINNETKLPEKLVEVDENVEYTLYLDKYGYVRAYSNETRYALITEVYPTNAMNQAWVTDRNLTAEVLKAGETVIKEYSIANNWYSNGYNPFYIGDNKGWEGPLNTLRLNWLQPATHSLDWNVAEGNTVFDYDGDRKDDNLRHSWTNVAKYTPGSDEKSINLFTAADYDSNNRVREDYVQLAIQNVSKNDPLYAIDDVDYQNYTHNPSNHYVRAVDDTIFFAVSREDGKIGEVRQWKGYNDSKAIDLDVEKNGIRAMYAVAVNSSTDADVTNYWTADVIVIEIDHFTDSFTSISLIYSNDSKISGDVKYLQVLDSKLGAKGIIPNNVDIWRGQFNDYGFYGLKNVEKTEDPDIYTADIYPIHTDLFNTGRYTNHYDILKDCADHNIYFGRVRSTDEELARSTYITVDVMGNQSLTDVEDTTTIRLAADYGYAWSIDDTDTYYNTASQLIFGSHGSNRVEHDDFIMWVYSNKDNGTVGYIVDLTDSDVWGSNHTWDNPLWLEDIAREIAGEQNTNKPVDPDPQPPVDKFSVTYKYGALGDEALMPLPDGLTDVASGTEVTIDSDKLFDGLEVDAYDPVMYVVLDKIEVNGAALEPVDGEYTFTVTANTEVAIFYSMTTEKPADPLPPVDPDPDEGDGDDEWDDNGGSIGGDVEQPAARLLSAGSARASYTVGSTYMTVIFADEGYVPGVRNTRGHTVIEAPRLATDADNIPDDILAKKEEGQTVYVCTWTFGTTSILPVYISFKSAPVDPGPDEPGETVDVLPYRAARTGDSVGGINAIEFYAYDVSKAVEDVKGAIVRMLKEEDDNLSQLTAEQITISADGKTASWPNGLGGTGTATLTTDTRGSKDAPKKLYKIDYKDETIYYAYADETVTLSGLDAGFVAMDNGEAYKATVHTGDVWGGFVKVDAAGKAIIGAFPSTATLMKDCALVDVLPLTWASGISACQYKDNGEWKAVTAAGWIKLGTPVKAAVDTSVAAVGTIADNGLYQVRADNYDGKALGEKLGFDVAADGNFIELGELTLEMCNPDNSDWLALTATRVYTVRLNDTTELGNFTTGDKIDVSKTDLAVGDVVIAKNGVNNNDGATWAFRTWALSSDVKRGMQGNPNYIELTTNMLDNTYGCVEDDLYINLFNGIKVDFDSSVTSATFENEDTKTGTYATADSVLGEDNWYVSKGTIVNVTRDAGKIAYVTWADKSVETFGNPSNADTTAVTVTQDCTIDIWTAVTRLDLTIMKNDGSTLDDDEPIANGVKVCSYGTDMADAIGSTAWAATVQSTTSTSFEDQGQYLITVSGIKAEDKYTLATLKDISRANIDLYDGTNKMTNNGGIADWTVLNVTVTPNADGTSMDVVLDVVMNKVAHS